MFGFRKKSIMDELISKAISINKDYLHKIVFADDEDQVLQACSEIKKKRIAMPIIIGDSSKIHLSLERLGIDDLDEENLLDIALEHNKEKLDEYANYYVDLMKQQGKNISLADAIESMKLPQFYGAVMVDKGLAHGLIAGATSRTKPYKPVFEIIRTAAGVERASGIFLMYNSEGRVYFFADCALNINPSPDALAEIALLSAKTCESLDMQPKVAMLSFSTRGSAKHEMVDKVRLATELAKKKNPSLIIDGEIQLDAAIDIGVSKRKCPDSVLKGKANVLIFPDLNSGNIGYKLVQRLANYEAIGPILQGLRKPANDLSRGCTKDDVINLTAITVIQSMNAAPEQDSQVQDSAASVPNASDSWSFAIDDEPEPRIFKKRAGTIDDLPPNVRNMIEESRKKSGKLKEQNED
jgi:phosphate acetyltransferase